MRRSSQPILTDSGEATVTAYTRYLHDEQDVSVGTRRSYLSELRQFAAWCEARWSDGHAAPVAFAPQQITTPLGFRWVVLRYGTLYVLLEERDQDAM